MKSTPHVKPTGSLCQSSHPERNIKCSFLSADNKSLSLEGQGNLATAFSPTIPGANKDVTLTQNSK
eukprot:2945222-Amphidinium_carterae.1